jgi:putative oxidoreductase
MATATHLHAHHRIHSVPSPTQKERSVSIVNHGAMVLGRIFYSSIFILASFNHFTSSAVEMAQDQGVPYASLLVPVAGIMALAGGLSILFAFKEKIGALLLMAFLIPVTIMMHNFWAVSDPGLQQIQMGMLMKNVALFGAAVMIYQYAPTFKETIKRVPIRTRRARKINPPIVSV